MEVKVANPDLQVAHVGLYTEKHEDFLLPCILPDSGSYRSPKTTSWED